MKTKFSCLIVTLFLLLSLATTTNLNTAKAQILLAHTSNSYHSWNRQRVYDVTEYYIDTDTIRKNPPVYEVDYFYVIHCEHKNTHNKIGGSFKLRFAPRHYFGNNFRHGSDNDLWWADVKKATGKIWKIGEVKDGSPQMSIYKIITK